MKKAIALSCLAALLLAGCTKPDNNNNGDNNSTTENTTAAVTTEEAATTTEAETTTAVRKTEPPTTATHPETETTTFAEPDENFKQRYDGFFADVKPMLSSYFDKLLEENGGHAYMEYAIYDVDKCGVPELIIKQGNSEADFTTYVYKEDGFDGMYQIGELDGSHTSFYNDETDRFVIVWAQMGTMSINHTEIVDYKLQETDMVQEVISDERGYDDIIKENGLTKLPCITVYKADKDTAGFSYIYSADGTEERKEELYFEYKDLIERKN